MRFLNFFKRGPVVRVDVCETMKAKLQSMANEGFFQAAIEKAMEDAATAAVKDLFGRYGKAGEAVAKGLKDQLNVDFSQVGLAGYNEIVQKIVQRKVEEAQLGPAQEQLSKMLDEIFMKPGESIELEKLVASFREHLDQHDREGERPTVILERDRENQNSSLGQYWRLYLDGREDTDKYACKYRLAFDGEGKAYSMEINDTKLEKKLFMGNFYDFEKFLFQIYTNKTPVVIGNFDPDYIEEYESERY